MAAVDEGSEFMQNGNFSKIFFSSSRVPLKVARWFILRPKIPIWVNLGGP
jgi:hypothetical protein